MLEKHAYARGRHAPGMSGGGLIQLFSGVA
jgi:hypothetical protein